MHFRIEQRHTTMNMRPFLSSLILMLSTLSCHAQTFLAGNQLATFVDVEPDTLISYSPCPPSGNDPLTIESYFVDMNGDLVDDFVVRAHCDLGNQKRHVSVIPLNDQSFARFMWSDSVFVAQYMDYSKVKMAEQLSSGTLINSPSAQWRNEQLYLSYDYMGSYYNLNVAGWAQSSDKYVGVRLGEGSLFRYGWIRLNCPSTSECIVKDHALGDEVLEQNTGVAYVEDFSTKVYMDPLSNRAVIEISSAMARKVNAAVYDMVGRHMGISLPNLYVNGTLRQTLDVSALSAGQYLISFTDWRATLSTVRIQKVN